MQDIIKLDKKDKKILYELDLDARQPYSKIAKKVKLSKEVVKYRIDRMVNEGLIEKFVLMINGHKLGYVAYKFYIQLYNITQEQLNKLIEDIKKNPNIIWVVTCDGRYDLIIALSTKNNISAYEIMNNLLRKYHNFIKELMPLNYIDVRHQKRTYLIESQRTEFEAPFWGEEPKTYDLDKYERALLAHLCENARKPITEIASSIKCSVDILHNRIKKLQKEGIIQGSRIMINKSLLGYEYYKILLNIQFNTEQEEKDFFAFLKNESNIIDVIRMMGNWNFELDIDVKNATEFHNIIMRLKSHFPRNVQSYESLVIFKEYKYNLFTQGTKYSLRD